MLNEVRELGFAYAELGHATRLSLLDGVLRAVSAQEIKISSLHNFCPLPLGVLGPAPDYYLPSSRSDSEHEQAVRHTKQTIDWAVRLGAKLVVLHLGLVPMRNYTLRLIDLQARGLAEKPKFQRLRTKALLVRERKRGKHLDAVYRFLEQILPLAIEADVTLGMETRLGIEEIPSEDEVMEILQRFGGRSLAYWHDVAHAQFKENLALTTQESLLERFRGRTAGIHLQDCAPPISDHLAPGAGTFDFSRLSSFAAEDLALVWEIHSHWTKEQLAPLFPPVHQQLQPMLVR